MANTLKNVEFKAISSKDSTKYVSIKGYYVKETDFVISDVVKSANFSANEIEKSTLQKKFQLGNSVQTTPTLPLGYHEGLQPFYFVQGGTYVDTEPKAWAVPNGYTLYKDGVDISGPIMIDIALNAGKTVVTFTFNKLINNKLADNAALKAATTIATTGGINGTFAALDALDAVSTPDGTTATYTITFNAALTGTANAIKIAAGALKDALGILSAEIKFNVDITVTTTVFYPAGSATSISRSINNIKVAFNEKQYVVATHIPVVSANLTDVNVIFKLTNAGGADVPAVRTVSPDGKSINIAPVSTLLGTQAYYVAITAWLEDSNQNATAAGNATWTTIA